MMRARFLGVRGSVPHVMPSCMRYGCNTACIEVVDEASGRVLILDAGTGLVGLGEALAGTGRHIPIVLTHFHFDHVQGLPFFAPVYRAGESVSVWAPDLPGSDGAVTHVFDRPYHPVPANELASPPAVHVVGAGAVAVNGFDLRVQAVTHPGGAVAYRIRGGDRDLVYLTDHEFGDPAVDEALLAFASGADHLIMDAHFTPEERPWHIGWGHADWHECATFARACGAGHLWLTHHKPGRTDEALDRVQADTCGVFAETRAAREGDTFMF